MTDKVGVCVVRCRVICCSSLSLFFLWLFTCAYQEKPLDFTLTFGPKLLSVKHQTCTTSCLLVWSVLWIICSSFIYPNGILLKKKKIHFNQFFLFVLAGWIFLRHCAAARTLWQRSEWLDRQTVSVNDCDASLSVTRIHPVVMLQADRKSLLLWASVSQTHTHTHSECRQCFLHSPLFIIKLCFVNNT